MSNASSKALWTTERATYPTAERGSNGMERGGDPDVTEAKGLLDQLGSHGHDRRV